MVNLFHNTPPHKFSGFFCKKSFGISKSVLDVCRSLSGFVVLDESNGPESTLMNTLFLLYTRYEYQVCGAGGDLCPVPSL